VIAAFVTWVAMIFLLIAGEAERDVIIMTGVLPGSSIVFYSLSIHRLIPRSQGRRHYFFSYMLKVLLWTAITFFPIAGIVFLFILEGDTSFGYSFLNSFFQLFITAPATWLIFKRKQNRNEEVTLLQKELKQSTASIDFLRSQINPHFLFNALNTLYGTAIQENAERTGEGIQKLGDMMRFMLQENIREKISLSREIDYLQNYISLQKLRTDPSPGVQIQTEIRDSENPFRIAPMLLIPFVENAFKHGISLRETSEIKISLEIKNNTLYFDVSNSKHTRPQNDPEKDKSGIGLENVKQRLKLLYPGRHELIIHETPKDFFVHLTIQLA
jgi:two-component system, LytTR family, sensor kinase